MNYTDEDFERLYVRYKAECLPRNMSMKEFCFRNKVPFGRFNKWWHDTRHRVVPIEVEGLPDADVTLPEDSDNTSSWPDESESLTGNTLKVMKSVPDKSTTRTAVDPASDSLRIMADIRMSNGLHVSRRNMNYAELRRLVESLEALC